MNTALICIDFINEIVASSGKLAGKGYFAFTERHQTLRNLAAQQASVRANGGKVIHVCLGFAEDYADHPSGSPLLGGAAKAGILKCGTDSTTIHKAVSPQVGDVTMFKKRISAFYGTSLELTLRALGVQEVLIAGVSTDLAVQSAARDAHDRDFVVRVVKDCCAAASDEDHEIALRNISKYATVI